MEIHAELKTASKMFCGCKNDPFHAPAPNTYTCPVCLGMPGALPVANKKAVELTIKFGLALNCKINLFSKFDRKHYFYPDLPKGYQISQYDIPFCYDGVVETSEGPVRIHRIHLEEDTGKLQHKTVNGEKVSLIDFNRSSVPLMEIVTEADIKSPTQAKEYAKNIRQLLRYLDIADCDMEQGGMRLEANISLAPEPNPVTLPSYKVEVKNINSFRFLEQAITFEMQRQMIELSEGRTPNQETRGWDSSKNVTFPQRSKEDAEDYRYFPDPDIPPIRFSQEQIETWRRDLPKLPGQVAEEWLKTYGVEKRYSETLLEKVADVNWYETAFKQLADKANQFAAAVINGKVKCAPSDSAETIATQWLQSIATETIDEDTLTQTIDSVLQTNADVVAKYRAGKTEVIGFLLGQTMKALGKKVDPSTLRQQLLNQLSKD